MEQLKLEQAGFRYNGSFTLQEVNITITQGDFVGVIGPNGSGKSTLFKLMSGYLRPQSGRVLLEGRELHTIPRKQVARKLAVVAQGQPVGFEYSVADLVRLGRIPYLSRWQSEAPGDEEIINQAMATTRVLEFKERSFTKLSGGEAQRVMLAQALAQQPEILLLDEPTTFLDLANQQEIFNLMADLNCQGVTVAAVLHDINLAALYCKRLVAMKKGRVFAEGPAEEVITPEIVQQLFDCRVEVFRHPHYDKPQIALLPGKADCPAV